MNKVVDTTLCCSWPAKKPLAAESVLDPVNEPVSPQEATVRCHKRIKELGLHYSEPKSCPKCNRKFRQSINLRLHFCHWPKS